MVAAPAIGATRTQRMVRRGLVPLLPLLSIVPALGIASLIIWAAGVNPADAVRELIAGAFGDRFGIGVTAIRTIPLMITGLGVAVGIRVGLWNLGGEGQIYMGALTATVLGLYILPGASGALGIAILVLAGFLGGGVWGLIPGVLRAYRGVNEVITTLLMSFVAINSVTVILHAFLQDPTSSYAASPLLSDGLKLPILLPRTEFHAGFVIGLILAGLLFVAFRYSDIGLELRAVGSNQKAARFAGIPVRRRLIQAMVVSGGLAGIAGAVEILGLHHRLAVGFSPGYGFDAVAVALLGGADPRFVPFAAVFLGSLSAGAPAMERGLGLPSEFIPLTEGLIVLFVVAAYGLRSRLQQRMALEGGGLSP